LKTIRYLKEIGRGDPLGVGNKAAALGELTRAGFNVPDGFVLTTAAYSQVLQGMRARLEPRITTEAINDPAEIESLAGEIRAWIEDEKWPLDLQDGLAAALTTLSFEGMTQSFAARTSLPSEELATAFGSGVQRAVLGLVGLEQVRHGAARCWGALWTSRSMYYRHRKRIPQTEVSIAVLVQAIIPADSAGTIYTQNPLTNDDDEIQIDSIWGLGAPLTQARVKGDRFLVGKKNRTIRSRQIEDKTVRLAVASGGSLEQQAVEAADVAAASLSDHQILAVAGIAADIDKFFGEAQYLEWARIGEQFFILQARPIAARKT
jgi:phosphoenolpyruvate synthase/pyruvate phosphate dikinase